MRKITAYLPGGFQGRAVDRADSAAGHCGCAGGDDADNWKVDFLYNRCWSIKSIHLNPLRYYKMVFSRLAVAILIGGAAYAGWQTRQAFVTSSTAHFLIGRDFRG